MIAYPAAKIPNARRLRPWAVQLDLDSVRRSNPSEKIVREGQRRRSEAKARMTVKPISWTGPTAPAILGGRARSPNAAATPHGHSGESMALAPLFRIPFFRSRGLKFHGRFQCRLGLSTILRKGAASFHTSNRPAGSTLPSVSPSALRARSRSRVRRQQLAMLLSTTFPPMLPGPVRSRRSC